MLCAVATAIVSSALGEVYFKDTFETDPFASNRWVLSKWKQDSGEAGKLEWSGGVWPASDSRHGLRTTEDARFYAASAKVDKEFNNEGKTLVFQFSAKHEQKIDCGGGYLKLFPAGLDQEKLNGDAPYEVMFGPDICGYSTKKVHSIFGHNGENLLKTSDVSCPDDEFTHVYTLIVNPDETYEIRVDGEKKDSGKLKDAWAFEKPKKIKDPKASKPTDWVDTEMMDDPEDKKPADWDSEPEKITDPDAVKPEDWDDDDDGEWEAPLIDNPKYKGEWKPKQVKNPAYKGPWVHPEIDNPDYKEEKDVYKRKPIGYVGFEIWQVKAGTVFSDIILTDSVAEAEKFYEETKVPKDAEEKAKKAYDDANKPAEEATSGGAEKEDTDLDEDEEKEEKDEL
jgi:calreticulin